MIIKIELNTAGRAREIQIKLIDYFMLDMMHSPKHEHYFNNAFGKVYQGIYHVTCINCGMALNLDGDTVYMEWPTIVSPMWCNDMRKERDRV